jgi:hypothetical protein
VENVKDLHLERYLGGLLLRRDLLRTAHSALLAYEPLSAIREVRRLGYEVTACRMERIRALKLARYGSISPIETELDQLDSELEKYGIPYDF